MSHNVICQICKQKFDRDKYAYGLVASRRYAHASCILRQAEIDPTYVAPEIIDPMDTVTCIYCKQTMDRRNQDVCIMIKEGKYAHKACQEAEDKRELTDEEKLAKYIENLYNMEYVPPNIQKQIKTYIKNYNYSYSGMLKALIYGIEITKKFNVDITRPSIAFLPYIYNDAYNYYYSLWLAQEANTNINIKAPEIENITIQSPIIRPKIKQPFTAIWKDEVDGL